MVKKLKRLALVLLILVVIVSAAGFVFFKRMGSENPARIDLSKGAVGLKMQFVYGWLIPVEGGVVLIDAGGDAGAAELIAELKSRGLGPDAVKAVLLTHGHFDHWPGCAAFPKAPVYVHGGDLALLRGEQKPRHWLVKLMTLTRKSQPPPDHLVILKGGETLKIGGESFATLHIPGHTAGSLMFVWNGILFTGDSIQVDHKTKALTLAPEVFSDDLVALKGNLLKTLPGVSFDQVATSHSGMAPRGRQDVLDFLNTLTQGKQP